MSASTAAVPPAPHAASRPARILLYAFITLTAVVWLVPDRRGGLRLVAPVRRYGARRLLLLAADSLTLDNYRNAWEQGDIPRKYWNTAVILVPALLLTLFFSSMVAFVCSRYSWRFNILLLSIFTAGNLLPQQIIIQPLFQFYNRVELPELALELRQAQRQRLGTDPDPRRVPERVLHLRAQQLHEAAAEVAERGGADRRRRASGSSTGRSSCR